jgi:hypothetical protein
MRMRLFVVVAHGRQKKNRIFLSVLSHSYKRPGLVPIVTLMLPLRAPDGATHLISDVGSHSRRGLVAIHGLRTFANRLAASRDREFASCVTSTSTPTIACVDARMYTVLTFHPALAATKATWLNSNATSGSSVERTRISSVSPQYGLRAAIRVCCSPSANDDTGIFHLSPRPIGLWHCASQSQP